MVVVVQALCYKVLGVDIRPLVYSLAELMCEGTFRVGNVFLVGRSVLGDVQGRQRVPDVFDGFGI